MLTSAGGRGGAAGLVRESGVFVCGLGFAIFGLGLGFGFGATAVGAAEFGAVALGVGAASVVVGAVEVGGGGRGCAAASVSVARPASSTPENAQSNVLRPLTFIISCFGSLII